MQSAEIEVSEKKPGAHEQLGNKRSLLALPIHVSHCVLFVQVKQKDETHGCSIKDYKD